MTLTAPLVGSHRLIFIVYCNDVYFRATANESYPAAGPVASVLLSSLTSSDAPGPVQIITSKARDVFVRQYIGWSDVTESVVKIRSPFCGYNMAYCVELKFEHLSCYCYKLINWIRKCPYSHWLTIEAYKHYHSNRNLSAFYLQKSGHRYETKLRHC